LGKSLPTSCTGTKITLATPEEELGGHIFLFQDKTYRSIFFPFLCIGGGEETEGKRTRGERKKAKNIRPGITLKIASAARQSRMSTHSAQNKIKK